MGTHISVPWLPLSWHQRASLRRIEPYDIVRTVVALILLVAAVLKAYQLATEPTEDSGLLSYRWALTGMVEFELFLGLWLLSGLYRFHAWALTTMCFAMFIGITLHKAISGEASCGCFGKVQVNPWITLILDTSILAACLTFRPGWHARYALHRCRLRWAVAISVFLTAGIPAAFFAMTYQPSQLLADGSIAGQQRYVVLKPQDWQGSRLPLLNYIDIGKQLESGKWTVIFFHQDCPSCRKLLRELGHKAANLPAGESSPLALVELPPYGGESELISSLKNNSASGKLADTRNWFMTTPTVVTIANGTVTSVVEGGVPDVKMKIESAPASAVAWTAGVQDFGSVAPGDTRRVTIEFHNPGEFPIKITDVRSECTCVRVRDIPSVIAPGATMKGSLVFIAPDEPTKYSKRVLFFTSDPSQPMVTMLIAADVRDQPAIAQE